MQISKSEFMAAHENFRQALGNENYLNAISALQNLEGIASVSLSDLEEVAPRELLAPW